MSWINAYLKPQGMGRSIGVSSDGTRTADIVMVNPNSGLVYIKEGQTEGYITTVQNLGNYRLHVFNEGDISMSLVELPAPEGDRPKEAKQVENKKSKKAK